jgi:hypothetical protein
MSVSANFTPASRQRAYDSTGLRLLAMKPTPIEKFQYLVHLKATNPHLFYRLLSQNIKVRITILKM